MERKPDRGAKGLGLDFSEPPVGGKWSPSEPVTSWSVESRQYGEFLVQFSRNGPGRYSGSISCRFSTSRWARGWEWAQSCVFAETCGNALVLEHNGDLFSCDHYVYPRYKLGNLMNTSLGEMVNSPEQRQFGNDKSATLPKYCRECDVRFACNGECPKHRFIRRSMASRDRTICVPYDKRFFHHVDPYMRQMAELLRRGESAAAIMKMVGPPGFEPGTKGL